MNNSLLRIVRWLLAITLAIIFIYSGFTKIIEPAQFAQDIANYKILPDVLINVVALYLPWLELLVGLVMLWPAWQKTAILFIVGMTLVFIFAISSAMMRGLDIDCGCFGAGSTAVGLRTLLIDVGILFASFLLMKFKPKPRN